MKISKPSFIVSCFANCFFLLFLSSSTFGGEPVSQSFWSGVAIGGMDTTEYHSAYAKTPDNQNRQRPSVEGDGKHEFEWKGATWRFATREALEKFSANPEKYVPKYNGHCSNALSTGEGLVATGGEVWDFFGGELHLFYAERGRQNWLRNDWGKLKKIAEAEWKRLSASN